MHFSCPLQAQNQPRVKVTSLPVGCREGWECVERGGGWIENTGEAGGVSGQQVSTATTTHHTHHPCSPTAPPLHQLLQKCSPKLSHGGSVVGFWPEAIPTSCFADAQPHHHHHRCHLVRTTTTPLRTVLHRRFTRRARSRATTARFRIFWLKPHPPPHISQTHHSTTTTTLYAPPSHPYTPFSIAVSHGAPETEPQWLGFVFLAQTPSPTSCFTNAPLHHHHHLVRTTIPPLCNVLHRCFTRHARNRATMARFRVFGSNPIPHLAFHEHTTPPQPPSHTHHHSTPMQRSPLPFHTACPKPSHSGSVSYFWLKPHPSPRISRTHHPTTTSSYAPLHRIPASPTAIVPNSTPEIEPYLCCFRRRTPNRASQLGFVSFYYYLITLYKY